MARYEPGALVCQVNPYSVRVPTRVATCVTDGAMTP